MLIHLVNHFEIVVGLSCLHIYAYPEGTKMAQMFILLSSLQFGLRVLHTQTVVQNCERLTPKKSRGEVPRGIFLCTFFAIVYPPL